MFYAIEENGNLYTVHEFTNEAARAAFVADGDGGTGSKGYRAALDAETARDYIANGDGVTPSVAHIVHA